MYKKILFILILFTHTGCAAPGTALLGPALTGATTKSVARVSLSFTSNQMIKSIHNDAQNVDKKVIKIVKKINSNYQDLNQLDFHN